MNRPAFWPSPSAASDSDFHPPSVLIAPLPELSTAWILLSPRVRDRAVGPPFSVLPSVGPGRKRPPPPPPPPAFSTVVFQLLIVFFGKLFGRGFHIVLGSAV